MTGGRPVEGPLSRRFFRRDAVSLARALLGRLLVHDSERGRVIGRIVETEAYDQTDPASHCFVGRTARNAVMFGPAGFAYVYRSYGIHWCFNVTADLEGHGAAVLVRAVEPVAGAELMARRRRIDSTSRDLARGPGRLTEAIGITDRHNGADLTSPSLFIAGRRRPALDVVVTPRVGITKAAEVPWRFLVAGNRFVSGPSNVP